MTIEGSLSPLIIKYEDVINKNPRSRVFAPLGECYRKLGLIDKAFNILTKGIRYNPDYVMGYISLSACYIDQNQDRLAYTTMRPLISQNRDNIRLQRLFAEVCFRINNLEESLDTYKYLLFINAKDKEVISKVELLENKLNETIILGNIEEKDKIIQFDLSHFENSDQDSKNALEEWVKVDLSLEKNKKDPISNWKMDKQDKVEQKTKSTEKLSLKKENASIERKDATPVITHTLVDLYLEQGHTVKAKEILLKILEINDSDVKTKKKLEEVEALMLERQIIVFPEKEEEKGRKNLMELFDEASSLVNHSDISEQLHTKKTKNNIENHLLEMNAAIKKRAQDIKSQNN